MILIRKEPYGTILEENKAYYVEIEEDEDSPLNCHIYLFDDEGNGYRYETIYYTSYEKMRKFWYGI